MNKIFLYLAIFNISVLLIYAVFFYSFTVSWWKLEEVSRERFEMQSNNVTAYSVKKMWIHNAIVKDKFSIVYYVKGEQRWKL